ncbi:hypothetical protein C8R45DRAFT_547131 [Mycena sanguinolenta]|nr:hypothetical protein C8R45DRAFT_547131 [Mycena sanguinolenta]
MADLQCGPCSFRWPEYPAYWSLDIMGERRLTQEEARDLEFPAIELTSSFWGRYWDGTVYAGLQQLHRARGFDPLSQEVAQHLGDPLYQPSFENEKELSFAHIDAETHVDRPSAIWRIWTFTKFLLLTCIILSALSLAIRR